MNYLDFFDIERKLFINEFLFEGWAKPEKLSIGKKSVVNLSLDDIKSVPTKFKIYFTFSVKFNSAEIRTKFEKKNAVESPNDTQSQIQKSMTSKASDMVSIAPKVVDYIKFYKLLVFPSLSSQSIKKRITQFAQAGTFNLEDFIVSKVTYPLINSKTISDILIWKQFCYKDKKDYKASPIELPFGFAIEFSATNKLKMYSRTEIMELVKELVPEFESAILKDNKYLSYASTKQAPIKEEGSLWTTKSPLAVPDDSTGTLGSNSSDSGDKKINNDKKSTKMPPLSGGTFTQDALAIAPPIAAAFAKKNSIIGRELAKATEKGEPISSSAKMASLVHRSLKQYPEIKTTAPLTPAKIQRYLEKDKTAPDHAVPVIQNIDANGENSYTMAGIEQDVEDKENTEK